jgi:hypothetical protein
MIVLTPLYSSVPVALPMKKQKNYPAYNKVTDFWLILKESIIKWLSSQCEAIYKAIMNFLVFWPFAFIISKKIRICLFELIKNEAALKVRYC